MQSLMDQVACNAAHYAIDNWFADLPPQEKAEMWQRFYDSAYCAIMQWDEAASASRFNATARVMEN